MDKLQFLVLIKIKPRICVLFIFCLTWMVNANSLKQNIKEICSFSCLGWMNRRSGDFVYRKMAAKNILKNVSLSTTELLSISSTVRP